jgi:hypothetical protein
MLIEARHNPNIRCTEKCTAFYLQRPFPQSLTIFKTVKQKRFFAVSACKKRTVGLVPVKPNIGDPCTDLAKNMRACPICNLASAPNHRSHIYCDKLPRRPKCLVRASVVSTVPSTAIIVQRAVTNY